MFCKFKDRAIIHVCPIKHVHGCVMRCFVVDGLAQVCSNSSALAMELLQTCAKPSILWIESKDTFTNNFQGCFHSGHNIHGTDVGLDIAIQMYWNAYSSSHKEIHACYMDLSNTGHGLIPGCGIKHSAISLAICVVGISIKQRDIAHLFRRRFECVVSLPRRANWSCHVIRVERNPQTNWIHGEYSQRTLWNLFQLYFHS